MNETEVVTVINVNVVMQKECIGDNLGKCPRGKKKQNTKKT